MGFIMLGRQITDSRVTSAWVQCPWVLHGYRKAKKTQITR